MCNSINPKLYPAIGIARHRIDTDSAGVTTLVASYGCPLRCKYCLNPFCFSDKVRPHYFNAQTLLEKLMVDDLYFQATGGGIVFGGGEPLLQADFIHDFCQICPKEWKISLESSMNVSLDLLQTVAANIDYYIIDIKDMNSSIYESYTGKNNLQVIQNLSWLAQQKLTEKVLIRLPLIPGYNTSSNIQESLTQLKEMGFQYFDQFMYRKPRDS